LKSQSEAIQQIFNLQSSIVNIQFRLVRVRDFRAANQGLSPYPDRGVCRIDPALR